MKKANFKIICLIIWACITVFSGYGDELTNNFESFVLETFNETRDSPYVFIVEKVDDIQDPRYPQYRRFLESAYSWKAVGSSFVTDGFPMTAYVDAWPIAAFGNNRNGEELKSFGIRGRFNRQAYNWIDIYPVDENDTPAEIVIPGRVRSMDMWVWGANLRMYIEVYLRDYQGVIHTLRLGDVSYTGWRNLRLNIPGNIPQSKRVLPAYAGLSFVKFRIWTQPVERVDNIFIYFKQLKILTDTYEALFDGNDLADPSNVERIWER